MIIYRQGKAEKKKKIKVKGRELHSWTTHGTNESKRRLPGEKKRSGRQRFSATAPCRAGANDRYSADTARYRYSCRRADNLHSEIPLMSRHAADVVPDPPCIKYNYISYFSLFTIGIGLTQSLRTTQFLGPAQLLSQRTNKCMHEQ